MEGKEEFFEKNEMELMVRIPPLQLMLVTIIFVNISNLQFVSSNMVHYKSAKTRGVCV